MNWSVQATTLETATTTNEDDVGNRDVDEGEKQGKGGYFPRTFQPLVGSGSDPWQKISFAGSKDRVRLNCPINCGLKTGATEETRPRWIFHALSRTQNEPLANLCKTANCAVRRVMSLPTMARGMGTKPLLGMRFVTESN